MEIAEETQEEQKKELPNLELDLLISDLQSALNDPKNSFILDELKGIVENDPELEIILREYYKSAISCELVPEDLDQIMNTVESEFETLLSKRLPKALAASAAIIFIAMMLMSNTGLIDGLGEKLSGDIFQNTFLSLRITFFFTLLVYLEQKYKLLDKVNYAERRAATVAVALISVYKEARANAALTGITLDDLVEDVSNLTKDDLIKRIGVTKYRQIHEEF
jgi:hypothetical protein